MRRVDGTVHGNNTGVDEMQVRRLEAKDTQGLQEMVDGLAAFHGDTSISLSQNVLEDLFGPRPWFIIFVAETEDGQLAGYTALTRIGQLQFAQRGLDMLHLFVRPNARGTGVGKALVQASVAYALENRCSALTVGTHPDNTDAVLFYETVGFERRPSGGPRLSIRLQPPT